MKFLIDVPDNFLLLNLYIHDPDEHTYSMSVSLPRLRIATPLEEARRSWVQNPTDLDLGFFHKQLERFRDPDNDEEIATRLVEGRRARLQKLMGQAPSEAAK